MSALIFILGVIFGALFCGLFSLGLYFLKRPLNNEKSRPIIGDRFTKARPSEKRKPKALTDLMAYTREIEEQGENRV